MNSNIAYLSLREKQYFKPNSEITLGQIAQIIAPKKYEKSLHQLKIYQVLPQEHLVVIDFMKIISMIKNKFPDIEVYTIGNQEIILEIVNSPVPKKPNLLAVVFVWILLFIGSGLAIMNFHYDVSMLDVHQRLYYLVTGQEKAKPLLLQIPYSLGIGLGMILFFNHLFKKKINEEPSPLEVEMFLYQKNLDQYVLANENEDKKNKQNNRNEGQ